MQRPPNMSYQPTEAEKRAAFEAREDKILSVQDRAEQRSEQMLRLYGSRNATLSLSSLWPGRKLGP